MSSIMNGFGALWLRFVSWSKGHLSCPVLLFFGLDFPCWSAIMMSFTFIVHVRLRTVS